MRKDIPLQFQELVLDKETSQNDSLEPMTISNRQGMRNEEELDNKMPPYKNRLSYREGINLLLLHGFLGTPDDWEPVCAYLEDFRPLCVELPGHGKTPFSEDFLRRIPCNNKIHLVGYSMGGRLAMQYAKKFPKKIASLTILSAHTGLSSVEEKVLRLQHDQTIAKKIIHSFDEFLDEWYSSALFAGFRPDLCSRKKHNPQELAKTLCYYSLGNQEKMDFDRALFLVGQKDEKYRLLQPNAIVVPNAGHMVHLENPKFVADLIRKQVENYV